MGHAPKAQLIYGYDLGGDDDGWAFAEYDQDECEISLPWFDPTKEFAEEAEKRLLAQIAGFTEEWRQGAGSEFFAREKAAKAQLGVEFEFYGYEMCGHALSAHREWVEWSATAVDLAALASRPAAEGWDDKLAAAVAALGITPKQERPGWLLAASYG